MKIQLIVLLALSLCVTSRDYDDDEGRPYEFGFTIDGQQHRHESKDVNGIVMGEFGFITADGIYHVTVYATDENGSFKILSMRNVRVSGPLDEPGYEFPSKTSGAIQQPQNNPPPPPPTTTTLAPTTNFKAPYIFTTLPSLKVPSCSSCKLPSTTPKPPGASNKLPFQTPEFQDKKPGVPPINSNPPSQQFNNPPPNSPFNNQPIVPPNLPLFNAPVVPQHPGPNAQNIPKAGPDSLDNFGVDVLIPRYEDKTANPVKPSIEQQPPYQNPGSNDIPVNPSPFGGPTHENFQNPPSFQNSPNPGVQTPVKIPDQTFNPTNQNSLPPPPGSIGFPFGGPTHENFQNPPSFQNSPNPGVQTPVKIPDQTFNPTNQNSLPPPSGSIGFPKPPPITISNQQINIPGKEPIPIKDPYPNMVDGLPNGITENDMLDLLYKFNYTLGFHGHHERGLKNGAKIGAYFVNGRDGIMRVVEYIADENGYRPKVKFINLGLDSPDTPKEGTEKTFGLKGFEFVWYPI